MAGDRLRRILTVISGDGEPWSSMRLCAACPGLLGVSGAGVMLMSGDIPRGSLCATDAISQLTAFSPRALRAGVRAIFGFPLRVARCGWARSTSTGTRPAR